MAGPLPENRSGYDSRCRQGGHRSAALEFLVRTGTFQAEAQESTSLCQA